MVALICSYKALVLGVRLIQARYSSDVNTLGEDGILPVCGLSDTVIGHSAPRALCLLSVIRFSVNWNLPLSRLMEGNSGADKAPSLSS